MLKKRLFVFLAVLNLLLPLAASAEAVDNTEERFCWKNKTKHDVTITSLTVYDASPPSKKPGHSQTIISATLPDQAQKVKKGKTVYWRTNFKPKSSLIKFKSNMVAMMMGPLGSVPSGGLAFATESGLPLLTVNLPLITNAINSAEVGQALFAQLGIVDSLPNVEILDLNGEPYSGWVVVAVTFAAASVPLEEPDVMPSVFAPQLGLN